MRSMIYDRGVETRQLEYAIAVADLRSFTRAAESWNIAQSALSHQVRKLEIELGSTLFERTTRRVAPTPAGELFLAGARTILAGLERLKAEAASATGALSGSIRVGMISTTASLDVAAVVAALAARHPALRFSLATMPSDRILAGLRDGLLDVGIVGLWAGERAVGVTATQVFSERLVVAVTGEDAWASPGTDGRPQPRSLRDLGGRAQIDFAAHTAARRETDEAFARSRVRRSVTVEAESVDLIVSLVRAGVGIAILPESAVQALEGIVGIPIRDGPSRSVYVAVPTRVAHPAVSLFASALVEQAARGGRSPVADVQERP
jgi:DNA-binding transcriptional LysR family regulator